MKFGDAEAGGHFAGRIESTGNHFERALFRRQQGLGPLALGNSHHHAHEFFGLAFFYDQFDHIILSSDSIR